jgi:hypothetical protein
MNNRLLRQKKSLDLWLGVSCEVASARKWIKTGLNHVDTTMFLRRTLLRKKCRNAQKTQNGRYAT